jgi:hypothetical protein
VALLRKLTSALGGNNLFAATETAFRAKGLPGRKTGRGDKPTGERVSVADADGALPEDDEYGLGNIMGERCVADLTPSGGEDERKMTFDELGKSLAALGGDKLV